MRQRALAALVAALVATVVRGAALDAQETRALLFATELTRLGGTNGGAVSADWLRVRGSRVLTVGLTLAQVGGEPWGRLGAQRTRLLRPGTHFTLAAEVGGGRKGDDSSYGILEASMTVTEAVSPGRLWLSVGAEAFSIDGQRAVLFQPSADVRLGLTTATARYGRSFGGDVGAEFVLARWRGSLGGLGWLGGVLVGEALHSPASRAADPLNQLNSSWEVFGGLVLQILGRPTTVLFKHRSGEVVTERSVLVSTRIGLR